MAEKILVNFLLWNGEKVTVEAEEGEDLLSIAHHNKVSLEGACEGSLACSTCHVVVAPEWFKKLDEASDKEEDMLDYAFGLSATSRLGCQIKVTKALSGITVSVPKETRNMQLEKFQS